MSRARIVLWGLLGALILVIVAVLQFHLPSSDVVRITGTEALIRQERTPGETGQTSQNLRLLYAQRVADGSERVFRNEDTGWGWPPYFKFNSDNIAARAANLLTAEPRPAVLVTYYGWRIPLLSQYPNVVGLREVPADYSHVPIFNIVFWIALIGLIAFAVLRIRRWRRRRTA